MPRIAGLVADGAEVALAGDLDRALESWRRRPDQRQAQLVAPPARLGWCGVGRPLLARSPRATVTFDGRIFNRADLPEGSDDAERFLGCFEQLGFVGAVERTNGDFAVALHDRGDGSLWLGRDRLGVKPLYYAATSRRFAFASQPRTLLRLAGLSVEVDRQFVALFAASHYRYFDNRPEASPYLGVAQLPAGHWLQLRSGVVRLGRYFHLEEAPDLDQPAPELAERYRALLLDAVGLRLAGSDRPAFTLSGGMDSSSVLGCAARLGGPQSAISTVYHDRTYDESDDIRVMLETTVRDWHPVAIGSPDLLPSIEEIVAIHEEPVATATWLSHHLLCAEVARLGHRSLFGGLGGDELNAGEYEHFIYFFADLRQQGQTARLAREIERWVLHHDHPVFRKSPAVAEEALARLVDPDRPGRCRADRRRLERYAATLDPGYFDLAGFEPVMEHPFSSYLRNRSYQDLTRETTPCCLRALDRDGHAFGLENLLPFLDHRVVELAFRVPIGLKYKDGVTKRLLREAMRGVLPEETRTRVKKTGWNAPAHVWFTGPGMAMVEDLVSSQRFRERGIYRLEAVRRILREHEEIVSSGAEQDNHMMFIWQLVNLELWLRSLDAG
jgi:asparagine synthase (glutamine-hydrolysing)